MQDLLEAVKPVLEEEQLQDAVDSLLMESSSYDAKVMYNAMKVWKHEVHANYNHHGVRLTKFNGVKPAQVSRWVICGVDVRAL